MFEELVLNKTPVKIYLNHQKEPLCGTPVRYNPQKGLLWLDSRVAVPEKYILKIETQEAPPVFKPFGKA